MAKKPRPAKPRVVVTRRLPPNVEARMAELFDAVFNVGDVPMDRTALARAMAQSDVLVPAVTDQIDAALIDLAPDRLQLIASFGSGVDHIDLGAARRKGIIVTNTPGVLTEDTADMTMALILSVPRRLAEAVSGGLSPNGPPRSGCRSPIITVTACRSRWNMNWKRHGMPMSIRCLANATSCRSTARSIRTVGA